VLIGGISHDDIKCFFEGQERCDLISSIRKDTCSSTATENKPFDSNLKNSAEEDPNIIKDKTDLVVENDILLKTEEGKAEKIVKAKTKNKALFCDDTKTDSPSLVSKSSLILSPSSLSSSDKSSPSCSTSSTSGSLHDKSPFSGSQSGALSPPEFQSSKQTPPGTSCVAFPFPSEAPVINIPNSPSLSALLSSKVLEDSRKRENKKNRRKRSESRDSDSRSRSQNRDSGGNMFFFLFLLLYL
jgi:hypothetical protein